jgi:hypothetical protein
MNTLPKPLNIMLDLETLGTKPGCVVLSIGAVSFDAERIVDAFYVNIKPDDAQRCGLTIDASTVMWWMQQSKQARAAFNTGSMRVHEALINFNTWLLKQRPSVGDGRMKVWGNGASFDQPVLEAVYAAVGIANPWQYRDCMCYRTLKNLVPDENLQPPHNDEHHNALADARWQALHLQRIACVLGLEL